MKCANCKDPLNQFDIAFHKHFRFRKTEECSCVRCNTDEQTRNMFRGFMRDANNARKQKKAVYRFWLSLFIVGWSVLNLVIPLREYNEASGISIFLLVCSILFCIVCDVLLINSFVTNSGSFESTDTGYHYESTIGDNGTITTTRVTDTSDRRVGREGPNELGCIILFVYAPLWILPYTIWMFIRRKDDPCAKWRIKGCVPEVAEAYVKAHREVQDCYRVRDQIDAYVKKHWRSSRRNNTCFSWRGYEERKKAVVSRYSVLNQDIVNEKLQELKIPFIKIEFNGIRGVLVWYDKVCHPDESVSTPWHRDKKSVKSYFIVYEAGDGKMRGTILDHDYFLLLDDDWLSYFREKRHKNSHYDSNHIPEGICDVLEEYKNDYHGLLKRIRL